MVCSIYYMVKQSCGEYDKCSNIVSSNFYMVISPLGNMLFVNGIQFDQLPGQKIVRFSLFSRLLLTERVTKLFRHHTERGFQLEYSTSEFFTDCVGEYTNASGILTSPSYPKLYPHLADCSYFISQPIGTFVNISFITLDVNCQKTHSSSDYIEMRDGNSGVSPLMGRFCGDGSNVPEFMQTTQNHLRIR